MGKVFQQVNETESRLVSKMAKEGIPWTQIQRITGRSPDTINSILKGKAVSTGTGAAVKFSAKDLDKVMKVTEGMVKKADAQKEITLAMIVKKAGVDVSERTVRDGMKEKKYSFFKLKEKPLLTDADIVKRRLWTGAHKRRTRLQWVGTPHAIIDNKKFPKTSCRKSREYSARRSVRGAYMQSGSQPKRWLVKPKNGSNTVKYSGVTVSAGVIKGRIRFWHYVDGRWNAAQAEIMYRKLHKALTKAYPSHKGPFTIIEDNDPTGYKSRRGMETKKKLKIHTDNLPPRSPDLNVLDYSLWHQINVAMRTQERAFSKSKHETTEEFKARLRRVALSLSETKVEKAVGSMVRRCAVISAAAGELFTE